MSHLSVRGEQSTSSEITALTNLAALGISGAGQAITKTGATTFANAAVGVGTITAVGNVSSGAAFDGTQGTTLTFLKENSATLKKGDATSSNTAGGVFIIQGAAGNGSGIGGDLSIFAGNGGATGNGGSIDILSGYSEAGGGAFPCNIYLDRSVRNTDGPDLSIYAGTATGTDRNGGHVLIFPGTKNGSGLDGYVKIYNRTNNRAAVLDMVNIASTNKTFTFPNESGTFVLADATQELDNKTLDSSVGKGTWTASGTWTLPAITLGGTVSGGGNQLNNIIIGTVTPLAAAFTTIAGASTLTLGAAGGTTGSILLKGTTSGTVTITVAAAAGTYSLTLPANDGDADQFLQTNGSGTLSWVTAAGTGDVTSSSNLTDNAIVRGDGGAKGIQTSSIIIDDSNNITGVVALTTSGLVTSSLAGVGLRVVNTTDNASVQVAKFEGDRATMADNDEAYISLLLSNDGGTQTEFGRITWVATDVNAGTSVDGQIDFAVTTAGTLADEMRLDGAMLAPSTSDGLALGSGTLMWADLFLANAGTINFDNSDVIITHSSNQIAISFGNLSLGSNSLLMTGSLGATGARLTKGWFTDLECTNAIVASITGNAATVTSFTPASGSLTLSGDDALTLTTTAATNVTLPTTGTLATLAGTEELDNKTLDASVGKGTWTASSWVLPALTAGGTITLAENASIALDPAGSADGKYSGITVTGTGGATIAFGDIVTLDKDDSRWELVDISVAAAATGDARGILGVAVTSSTDGGAITVLLHGIVRADANFPALTIGAPVYASTTGDVVVAQPTTTDHVIRVVGFAMTADELYFNPSSDYITHT